MMPHYLAWLRQYVGHAKIISTGAAALIRDERSRVLLIKRRDFGVWGLPGGSQEIGESIDQTIVREVREEVGLVVEPARLLGVRTSPRFDVTFPNGDEVQPYVVLFECRVLGGELKTDGDEVLDVGWFDNAHLPPMMRHTAMAIQLLEQFSGEPLFDAPENSATMITQNYVTYLRRFIGHAKVILPGAAGMVRDENGRVLLQRRRDNGLWGFPGGLLDLGESATNTVMREFREEVGLDVQVQRLIGVYTSPRFDRSYPNGDTSQLFASFFECRIVGGELRRQESEVLELGWFDLDHLPPMVACCEAKAHDARIFNGAAFWR
jgi:8-oxo-dGTP pyrophosphatase MutT (NUDIX family)